MTTMIVSSNKQPTVIRPDHTLTVSTPVDAIRQLETGSIRIEAGQ
jgi:hypothetical protein